jgi:hypothetical protein
VTFYDIPGIVNSLLDLAASPGIKAGFQVSGIYPLNRDIFHDEECMGAYVTDRSTSPVAAAAFNSNSKTPTSMDSTGPSISTSKEEARPFSPGDIRPLPKPRHRKSQNVKKKKRTTAILTDTLVKNALKKNYNARLGLFAQVSTPMDRNTLFKNEFCWLHAVAAAAALC